MNNEFEKWFSIFSEKSENLTSLSIKQMLELAYVEGFKQCEQEMPLYAKRDDGGIVEVPREVNESVLPNGEKMIDEDFDIDNFIKSIQKEQKDVSE